MSNHCLMIWGTASGPGFSRHFAYPPFGTAFVDTASGRVTATIQDHSGTVLRSADVQSVAEGKRRCEAYVAARSGRKAGASE